MKRPARGSSARAYSELDVRVATVLAELRRCKLPLQRIRNFKKLLPKEIQAGVSRYLIALDRRAEFARSAEEVVLILARKQAANKGRTVVVALQ
jgi:DNA-binding transcriptional MerR regulator